LDMVAKPWRILAVILSGAPPSTRELLKKFDQNFQSYGDVAVSVLSRQFHNLSFLGEFEGDFFEKKSPS